MDWHFAKAQDWPELVGAHERFVEDYDAQEHWGPPRTKGRSSLAGGGAGIRLRGAPPRGGAGAGLLLEQVRAGAGRPGLRALQALEGLRRGGARGQGGGPVARGGEPHRRPSAGRGSSGPPARRRSPGCSRSTPWARAAGSSTEAMMTATGQNIKRLLAFVRRGPRKVAQAAALRPPARQRLDPAHRRSGDHRRKRCVRPMFFNTLGRFATRRGAGGPAA